MTEPDNAGKAPARGRGAFAYTGLRVAAFFAVIIALALFIYALPALFNREALGAGTISIGFLLITPTCIGAIASLLSDPSGVRTRRYHILHLPLLIAGIVTLLGLIVLREGIICVAMLLPLWLPAISLGGYAVHRLHRRFHQRNSITTTFLFSFAALATLAGPAPFSTGQDYRVERAIIIDASADEIWPHLESIPAIRPGEGRWNITQGLLGVPRPVSARLENLPEQSGAGAVRFARWGGGIAFEEHVFRNVPGQEMQWAFVFPDPTLQAHIDRHIDPAGPHLQIRSGGYRLEALADGRTRVTLHTDLTLNTQLNAYPALWAHFMLGDIQQNILEIIRTRAESAGVTSP